jgi:hypothetical protein
MRMKERARSRTDLPPVLKKNLQLAEAWARREENIGPMRLPKIESRCGIFRHIHHSNPYHSNPEFLVSRSNWAKYRYLSQASSIGTGSRAYCRLR